MTVSRIVLAGAPGSHKLKFAYALRERFPNMVISDIVGEPGPDDPAVGMLADYRQEMWLAVARTQAMLNLYDEGEQTIFVDSLVDSVAHASVRAAQFAGGDDIFNATTWGATLILTLAMLRDSFEADLVLEFPPQDDANEYVVQIEDSLVAILESFGIETIHLSGEWEADLDLAERSIREAMDRAHSADTGESETLRESSEPDVG